jgi:hypothetical protein
VAHAQRKNLAIECVLISAAALEDAPKAKKGEITASKILNRLT